MSPERYPEHRSMFIRELPERDRRFAEAREAYLIGFGYNTARAYWGDLEHLYDWCDHRGFDIWTLTQAQFRQYQALLRRRKYSESSIRRRRTAYRGLLTPVAAPVQAAGAALAALPGGPAKHRLRAWEAHTESLDPR